MEDGWTVGAWGLGIESLTNTLANLQKLPQTDAIKEAVGKIEGKILAFATSLV
jgi:hypothetical protein